MLFFLKLRRFFFDNLCTCFSSLFLLSDRGVEQVVPVSGVGEIEQWPKTHTETSPCVSISSPPRLFASAFLLCRFRCLVLCLCALLLCSCLSSASFVFILLFSAFSPSLFLHRFPVCPVPPTLLRFFYLFHAFPHVYSITLFVLIHSLFTLRSANVVSF